MDKTPLLSICIPTYNRAEMLEKTILSIVSDDIFLNTDLVEIIVSDNCSTDQTEEICLKYAAKFPEKFFYYKNSENIGGDANILKVLSYGKGRLLKLNNDYCIFLIGTISKILSIILENIDEKNVLFFSNSLNKHISRKKSFVCKTIDDFILKVGHRATWIGAFSVWKSDYENFEDISRCLELGLFQTDVLLRLLQSGRSVYVNNESLFECPFIKRGGYNPAKLFGENYITKILRTYQVEGLLSKKTLEKEKRRVLEETILPFLFDFDKRNEFNSSDFMKILKSIYGENLYFYCALVYAQAAKLVYPVSGPIKRMKNLIIWNLKLKFNQAVNNKNKVIKYTSKIESMEIKAKETELV